MTSKEFYEEVKNSSICPNNFDAIYAKFNKYQNDTLKTLIEFHRVCEKYNVRYQLAFGSLLGAVRDDGQIPWDYDIDVIVPYEEKDKLVAALEKDLNEDFYYYCPDNHPECRHYFMRVTPREYDSILLHVDVFYMIGVPADETERNNISRIAINKYHDRLVKLYRLEDCMKISWKSAVKMTIKKIMCLFLSAYQLTDELDRICTDHPVMEYEWCTPIQRVYDYLYFPTRELWDTMILKTSVGEFRVTRNYDLILNLIYKDYRKIYPLESRLNEMMNSYCRISGDKTAWKNLKIGRIYAK